MPAKPCPSCGLKNPTRATTCDCGYHFGGPQALSRQVRCPSCGATAPAAEPICPCGHSFVEDTEEARHLLTHRLTVGWFSFIGGVLMITAGVGITIVQLLVQTGGVLLPTGFVASGIGLVVKGGRAVPHARQALARLGPPPAPPPAARVVKRP